MNKQDDEPIDAVLIAGPTASGKSDLAIRLAEKLGGTLINADSMQVYKGLSILTARPSLEDEARVPHKLYGFVEPTTAYSVAAWAAAATVAARETRDEGALPIFVGGTGLYFSVLSEGLSPIPEIPQEVRREVRGLIDGDGLAGLYGEVLKVDKPLAERVGSGDRQRLMRALEVFRATGEPLSDWQKRPRERPFKGRFARLVLEPDRQWVYERIERRFDQMMTIGALDEVRTLTAMDLDPALPVMKALGVDQLIQVQRGEKSLEEAVRDIKTGTRRFSKRQMTWFRNQMIAWNRISAQDMERKVNDSFMIIMNSGLTLPK